MPHMQIRSRLVYAPLLFTVSVSLTQNAEHRICMYRVDRCHRLYPSRLAAFSKCQVFVSESPKASNNSICAHTLKL